ncbi:MAG: immunoglobulin-like domain-containing protein [Bacteroidia bacterium]
MKNLLRIFSMLLLLGSFKVSYAQQPQYFRCCNTGGNYIPFGGASYMNYKSQYLNLFTEFNAVPPSGMVITKLYFRVYNTGSASFSDLKISLGQQSASITALTPGPWVATTQVYLASPTLSGTQGQWLEIVLDQPYPFDPTMGLVWEACMSSASGSGFALYTASGTGRRAYSGSGNCSSTASTNADGTWPDIGFDVSVAPTNTPKIAPLANFKTVNDMDTLWVGSPSVLVNTSSYSDTNYWQITGYNATTPTGAWSPYFNPNDLLQTNNRGTWIDTVVNKTNFYYTFSQTGYYRVKLFTGNRYGTSFVEKSVFVSNPTQKPKALFFSSKRNLATYDRSQFNDLSLYGPTTWKWWVDPPCYNCGLYKNEFFYEGNKNDSASTPYLTALDPGVYKVCLAVSNAMGSDTLCQNNYLRIVPGFQMCNGSDTAGTTSEGAVMPTLANSANMQYIANGCTQGFRIAPCADTIIVTLERLKLRNNGGPLNPGDSLYIKAGILPGSQILRRFGGNDINKIKDSLRTFVFSGQQLYVTYVPVAPTGPNTIVNDSGFLIRWRSKAASYAPPVAAFTCPDTIYSGYKVVFQNQSTGKYANYAWDTNNDYVFGKDNTNLGIDSTNLSPSMIYNESSITQKTVCLKTYNCVGSDTVCKTFTVLPSNIAPFADFTVNKTYGLTTDSFLFKDISFNGANQWKWEFEPSNLSYLGGTDSTSQHPMVFLHTNTNYSVTLTATNAFGSSTKKKTNYITTISYPSPGSQFTPTSSVEDFGITRVRLVGSVGRIDTTTALKPIDGSAYTPLYNLSKTTLYRGGKYTVDVYRGANPVDSMNLRVWMDFSRNANYLDAGETLINEDRQLKVKYTTEFTVPQDASIGVTRMLVGASAAFSTISPFSSVLGVYEEYGITIGRDEVKPVITLKGQTVAKTEINKTYKDSGAIAMDNIEGDISSRMVIISNVDITHIGYYSVKYVVWDNYGNLSDTIVRLVQVEINQTGPEITITGADTVRLEVRKDSYVDAGATAKDNSGADISNSILTSNNLDTANVGVYYYTYTVADAFGFISTKKRVIIVQDTEKPTIHTRTLNDTSFVIHQIKMPFDDNNYLRVDDNYWTNLTPVRTDGTLNIDDPGLYYLTYRATDGSGNVSDAYVLTVKVTNTFKPTITLVGSSDVIVKVNTVYNDPKATAKDYFNVPLLVEIVNDNMDINHTGNYKRTYRATDEYGNWSEVERTIHVKDLDAPVITVLGDNPVQVVVGTKTREEILAMINVTSIKVVDNYDPNPVVKDNSAAVINLTDKSGTYLVTYDAKDVDGNNAQQKQRYLQILPNTGIEQVQANNGIQVYPNPSKGVFHLELKQGEVRNIRIYNIAGVLVREFKGDKAGTTYQIDLSNERDGMYLIRVESSDKTYTTKVNLNR